MSQLDNVAPSIRLIEAAARAGATRFVGLGSQAEYGPQNAKLQRIHTYEAHYFLRRVQAGHVHHGC